MITEQLTTSKKHRIDANWLLCYVTQHTSFTGA
jgi:hypothetical protein